MLLRQLHCKQYLSNYATNVWKCKITNNEGFDLLVNSQNEPPHLSKLFLCLCRGLGGAMQDPYLQIRHTQNAGLYHTLSDLV